MFNFFKNEDRVNDPICNMSVNIKKTEFSTKYNGKVYYFCSENCKKIFDSDKENYA